MLSSFCLQGRLNDTVIGPELYLDEDFVSAPRLRARWALEQVEICPQTHLPSSPGLRSPAAHTLAALLPLQVFQFLCGMSIIKCLLA